MNTNVLSIKIVDKPSDAPNYARDEIDVRAAEITTAVIICKGTVGGNPTVDLQITTKDGSRFVAMLTGKLVTQLANAVTVAELRNKG